MDDTEARNYVSHSSYTNPGQLSNLLDTFPPAAASPTDQRPSSTPFNTCTRTCSFVVNISPFID